MRTKRGAVVERKSHPRNRTLFVIFNPVSSEGHVGRSNEWEEEEGLYKI